MSKKHMEANMKYVDEERRAPTEEERKAIANALAEMGEMEILGADAVLVGRQDEPYGWYLFDLGDCVGDGKGRYLILGDCLDVLPDYNRVLTLKEVHEFAMCEMDGRYEAIQKWGVFQSLSMGLKTALSCVLGDEGLDETMEWDDKQKEWKMRFDVSFTTDKGVTICKTIFIPALLSCKHEADNAFAHEWKSYSLGFSVEATMEQYINDRTSRTSFDEAWNYAKSEVRSVYEIENAIRFYTEYGKTDYGKNRDAVRDLQFNDGQGYVWVMTIMVEGQNFPEVHKTFDGAVESAINDIKEKMCELEEDERDEYDFDEIKKRLEEDRYWKDENTDTSYDIVDCPVSK